MQSTADFFTDKPLIDPMTEIWANHRAAFCADARWAGHAIVAINGHCVWKPWADLQSDDLVCFYDGDVRAVLAPDDPRILIPRAECADLPPEPARLEWDE